MTGKLRLACFICIAALLLIFSRSEFDYRLLPVPGDGLSPDEREPTNWKLGAVVAAARRRQDISWMDDIADNWTPYPFNVDAWFPPEHLKLPANKGHEAMAYLTFIINNWDDLPPRAIFVHGHRDAWHQEGTIVELISALRLPALEAEGYIPLRCDWYPSCPAEMRPIAHDAVVWGPGVNRQETEFALAEAWPTLFPGVELPETIAAPCCAQFAVTREAVRRRSKADYERIRRWILDSRLRDDVTGRVLEKLWAYIMTNETVRCPAPQRCACEFFGSCEAIEWTTPPKALGPLPEY